jgi:hypothetical protein
VKRWLIRRALLIADLMLMGARLGDHSYSYVGRIDEIRDELEEFIDLYYPRDRRHIVKLGDEQ